MSSVPSAMYIPMDANPPLQSPPQDVASGSGRPATSLDFVPPKVVRAAAKRARGAAVFDRIEQQGAGAVETNGSGVGQGVDAPLGSGELGRGAHKRVRTSWADLSEDDDANETKTTKRGRTSHSNSPAPVCRSPGKTVDEGDLANVWLPADDVALVLAVEAATVGTYQEELIDWSFLLDKLAGRRRTKRQAQGRWHALVQMVTEALSYLDEDLPGEQLWTAEGAGSNAPWSVEEDDCLMAAVEQYCSASNEANLDVTDLLARPLRSLVATQAWTRIKEQLERRLDESASATSVRPAQRTLANLAERYVHLQNAPRRGAGLRKKAQGVVYQQRSTWTTGEVARLIEKVVALGGRVERNAAGWTDGVQATVEWVQVWHGIGKATTLIDVCLTWCECKDGSPLSPALAAQAEPSGPPATAAAVPPVAIDLPKLPSTAPARSRTASTTPAPAFAGSPSSSSGSMRLPWTSAEDDALIADRAAGVRMRDTAVRLGRTYQGVTYRVKALRARGRIVDMLNAGPQPKVSAAREKDPLQREEATPAFDNFDGEEFDIFGGEEEPVPPSANEVGAVREARTSGSASAQAQTDAQTGASTSDGAAAPARRPRKKAHRFTQEEDARIKTLHAQGLTWKAIDAQLGRPAGSSCARHARVAHDELVTAQAAAASDTASSVPDPAAAAAGSSLQPIQPAQTAPHQPQGGPPYTQADDDVITALTQKDQSHASMGIVAGRSKKSIEPRVAKGRLEWEPEGRIAPGTSACTAPSSPAPRASTSAVALPISDPDPRRSDPYWIPPRAPEHEHDHTQDDSGFFALDPALRAPSSSSTSGAEPPRSRGKGKGKGKRPDPWRKYEQGMAALRRFRVLVEGEEAVEMSERE